MNQKHKLSYDKKINDNWIEIFQNEGCDKEKVRPLKWAIWIMLLTWTLINEQIRNMNLNKYQMNYIEQKRNGTKLNNKDRQLKTKYWNQNKNHRITKWTGIDQGILNTWTTNWTKKRSHEGAQANGAERNQNELKKEQLQVSYVAS